MSKLVAIFIIALLSLQMSWAAGANYCKYETTNTVEHFGHHSHNNKNTNSKSTTADFVNTSGDILGSDCSACHAGCSFAIILEVCEFLQIDISSVTPKDFVRITSYSLKRLERPKWHVLA